MVSIIMPYIFNLTDVHAAVWYPYEIATLPITYRHTHVLASIHGGYLRCIGCMLCEVVCPAAAILLTVSTTTSSLRTVSVFSILYNRCIFCGLCTEVCPVDCIVHQSNIHTVTSAHRGLTSHMASLVWFGLV